MSKLVAMQAKGGQTAYLPEDRIEAWEKAQRNSPGSLSDREKQLASEIVRRILTLSTSAQKTQD